MMGTYAEGPSVEERRKSDCMEGDGREDQGKVLTIRLQLKAIQRIPKSKTEGKNYGKIHR